MNSRARGAALVAFALLLAGCANDPSATNALSLGDGSTADLEVTPTQAGKGAIAGVVVDEAIRPIAGANITVPTHDLTAQSDEGGLFVFNDLEPAVYTLTLSAPGFLATQTIAEVVAGESTPLRVLLSRDLTPQPYHTTYPFDGFMQVSGGIGLAFAEMYVPGGTPLCNCRLIIQPEANVTDFVVEAFVDPTMPDPAGLGEFYMSFYDPTQAMYESEYCVSHCHGIYFTEKIGYTGTTVELRLAGSEYWVAYNQPLKLYITTFFNGHAPEGWTIADQA